MPLPVRKEPAMAQITIPDPQAGPTETDEEAVLVELYGPPDGDGVYGGEAD